MDLPRTSQEYLHITLANEPDGNDVVEASVDGGVTWSTVTVTGTSADVLLRGPDYRDDSRGLLIQNNGTDLLLRVKSDPEEISRTAAVVFLY
jgi:hypothetical protein